MKHMICLLACLLLLSTVAFAAPPDAQTQLAAFLHRNGLDETNFSLCYYNLVTGESAVYNENAFHAVGQVWTLPLHMYYYEQEHAGAFDPPIYRPDDVYTIGGLTLEECRYQSILLGNSEVSEQMCAEIGSLEQYQSDVNERFGHLDTGELPEEFFQRRVYNAKFLMNCLLDIAAQAETYGDLMHNYNLIQTSDGLAGYGRPFDLVHIRGEEDGYLCDIGRIAAPQPYLLVCFIREEAGGDEMLAAVNEMFCTLVEDAAGTVVPEPTQRSSIRDDSEFLVAGTTPNDHSIVLRWILIALGAAGAFAAVVITIVTIRRKKRRERRQYDLW